MKSSLTEDKEFLEKKAKELEGKVEFLEKEKVKAEYDVKTASEGALKRGNEKDAEIKKLEAALAAKGDVLKGLENKLAASKAINEEGVKTATEKQQVER